jgi:hypothetical protein
MAAIYQTAYPRIKSGITPNELGDVYTPTDEDLGAGCGDDQRSAAGHHQCDFGVFGQGAL